MIQRTLLRHSRALASCTQPAPRTLVSRSQFRPRNVAFAPASRPLAAARFYATEPESKAEETAAEGNGKDEKTNGVEAEAEDPVKKELESKNKEIIDLKVCQGVFRNSFTSDPS
jgi:molecular chaperone GrpE